MSELSSTKRVEKVKRRWHHKFRLGIGMAFGFTPHNHSMSQHLIILGIAFIFIVTGLSNRTRGKGPWRAFLVGGFGMTAWELLNLAGVIH
jgi:hypothetical protein